MPHVVELQVFGFHIDVYGHVNNGRYLEFLETARWHLLDDTGYFALPSAATTGLVVTRIDIHYRQPAVMGDRLRIETVVADVRSRRATFHQTITRLQDGKTIVSADVTFMVIDRETGAAIRLPTELHARLVAL